MANKGTAKMIPEVEPETDTDTESNTDLDQNEKDARAQQYVYDLCVHKVHIWRPWYETNEPFRLFVCPFPSCSRGKKLTPRDYVSLCQHVDGYSSSGNLTTTQRLRHRGLYLYLNKYYYMYRPPKKENKDKKKKGSGGSGGGGHYVEAVVAAAVEAMAVVEAMVVVEGTMAVVETMVAVELPVSKSSRCFFFCQFFYYL